MKIKYIKPQCAVIHLNTENLLVGASGGGSVANYESTIFDPPVSSDPNASDNQDYSEYEDEDEDGGGG